MGIDWNKLKEYDNPDICKTNRDKWIRKGREFEKLALDYLRDNFMVKWEETHITRDGNRDAINIVVQGQEEVWAEAKYTKNHRISRYRLDATIVSALIYDKKIVKVLFITNSNIDDKTQVDIERALKNALGETTDILFQTKYDIEFWLYSNPKRYTEYFNDSEQSLQSLHFSSIVANNISFYKVVRQSFCFREPLNELHVGNSYEMIFSIFSPFDINDCKINLRTNLINVQPTSINIKQGSNRLCLTCRALTAGHLPTCLMTIGKTDILLNKSVCIKKENIELVIKSQIDIKNNLLKSFEEFKKRHISCIHIINGMSGVGKTTLLENLIQSATFRNIDIIYQSMSRDKLDSNITIIDIILSILFYHIDPSTIDIAYLKSIKQHHISRSLEYLVEAKCKLDNIRNSDNIENFNTCISEYNESKEIFASYVELNRKVIILDDLHKLDESSYIFLFNFLEDLYSSKIPCFIILCARDSFWKNQKYLTFKQNHQIFVHNYKFDHVDLYNNLTKYKYSVNLQAISLLANRMDISIFSTKSLLEFLHKNKTKFDRTHPDSCHIIINHFISGDKYPKSIIELFKGLNTDEKNVVRLVYYSYSGVDKSNIKSSKYPIFEDLEHNGFFRIENQKYVPYHDVYQEIFKNSSEPLPALLIPKYLKKTTSEFEILRDDLLHCGNMGIERKEYLLHQIERLTKNHKFHTISYILDPIFSKNINEEAKVIENRKANLGLVLYYSLKFYYVYAGINCSKSINGDKELGYLYKEIKDILDPGVQYILLKLLAELVNSHYEHLLFASSHKYACLLKNVIYHLEKEGYIEAGKGQYNSSFILSKEVDMLTNTMLDKYSKASYQKRALDKLCIETNDFNKIAIITIRYARLMLHHNIELAYEYISKAVEKLKAEQSTEEKWILIGEFELCFIDIIRGRTNNIKELKIAHSKLEENFNNDYNRGCLIVAACYIYWKMPQEAYQYLYKDYFKKRQVNPRCEAMRLGLLAVYEYLFMKDKKNAIECLNKQKRIFAKLGGSYHLVIDNNIKLINSPDRNNKIAFFTNADRISLVDKCLYIDPRIW